MLITKGKMLHDSIYTQLEESNSETKKRIVAVRSGTWSINGYRISAWKDENQSGDG